MEQAAFDIRLFDHPNEWRHIRMEVFQKEQGFQNEFDALDAQALHLCAYHNEEAIGCLRLYSEDPTKKTLASGTTGRSGSLAAFACGHHAAAGSETAAHGSRRIHDHAGRTKPSAGIL